MRRIWLIFLLGACDASPAPQMMGAASINATVGGRDYTVWRQDKAFEVVRHGWACPGQYVEIRATMLALVAKSTGCEPHVTTGDSGEMRGTLSACK